MKDKALRNKQILIRLTNDEFQQMSQVCKSVQMNKSDYIRIKILTESDAQMLDARDIHAIRTIGIVLIKLLEELKDTQLVPHELIPFLYIIMSMKNAKEIQTILLSQMRTKSIQKFVIKSTAISKKVN